MRWAGAESIHLNINQFIFQQTPGNLPQWHRHRCNLHCCITWGFFLFQPKQSGSSAKTSWKDTHKCHNVEMIIFLSIDWITISNIKQGPCVFTLVLMKTSSWHVLNSRDALGQRMIHRLSKALLFYCSHHIGQNFSTQLPSTDPKRTCAFKQSKCSKSRM